MKKMFFMLLMLLKPFNSQGMLCETVANTIVAFSHVNLLKAEIKLHRAFGDSINEACKLCPSKYQYHTPLQIACQKEKVEIVELLLFCPEIEPNKRKAGNPPLHSVVQTPHTTNCRDIARLLIAHPKVDVNLPDGNHNTALHVACCNNNQEAVEELLDHPAITINPENEAKNTPLHIACEKGLINIVRLLVGKKCALDVENNQAETALFLASKKGYAEIVRLLLENGARIDGSSLTKRSILIATEQDHLDVVTALIEYNPDLTQATTIHDENLVFLAARYKSINILQYLLTLSKINIYLRDKNNQTPLHISCSKKDALAVRALLAKSKKGIDIQDKDGNTALHICMLDDKNAADQHISNSCVYELLKAGASTVIKNNKQHTPLACYAYEKKIKNLNADNVNVMVAGIDKHGNNQLHLNVTSQEPAYAYINSLTGRGVSIWARNNKGATPTDLACKEYNKMCRFYTTKPLPAMKIILDNQERIMHAYLRVASKYISPALFKQFFNLFYPLQEAQQHIMKYYYALNVETVIAHEASGLTFNKILWKDLSPEEKNKTRKDLIKKPQWPEKLWK